MTQPIIILNSHDRHATNQNSQPHSQRGSQHQHQQSGGESRRDYLLTFINEQAFKDFWPGKDQNSDPKLIPYQDLQYFQIVHLD